MKLGEANARRIFGDFSGSHILGAARDFDPRPYGCSNLSTLVSKSGGFEGRKEPGKPVFIRRKATGHRSAAQASGTA